jgi:hypothetical protein
MKIVIDIEDAVLDCVIDRYADGEMPDDKSVFDMALYAIATGKQLPVNATNGDVIKAICPMWINYHDTDVELIINNKDWNAPYKGGKE